MSTFSIIESLAARTREQAQAIARPARIRIRVEISGSGESRLEGKSGIAFGAMMMEEPSFSFGLVALGSTAAGVPQGCATVLQWRKSGKFWIGADLGFVVDNPNPNQRVAFTLTFEGSTLRTTAPTGRT